MLFDGPRAPRGTEALRDTFEIVPQLTDEVAQVPLLAGRPAPPLALDRRGPVLLVLLLGLEAPRERGVGLLLAPPRVAAAALLGLRTFDPLLLVIGLLAAPAVLARFLSNLLPVPV